MTAAAPLEKKAGLTALVLAGSRGPDDPMARAFAVPHKALIAVGGVPMLLRVITALGAAPEIARIVVIIEAPELVHALPGLGLAANGKPVETFPAAGSPSRSVVAALARYPTPLVITTADHALLQPEWLRYFLAAVPDDADAALALARSEIVLAEMPDTRRTWLRFSEGAYSGCNLFYFASPKALALAELWRHVEALRKRPVAMLRLLGWGYALRYRLGWLRLSSALARLGALADGAKAAAVEMPFARAAVDVDKPADKELVERLLAADRLST
ncbi:nucleotidyltransferase family protein [Nevskia sp.]|uniref:nucleotidyltransferase family protein n=1 Tax=Nevskia sp. TaxID=1929292 RepID=UPI0025D8BFFE|nr:nucleotidyltransferase family protein [Nevskia sp.]